MLDRIRDGRTDLVFEWIAEGHEAATRDDGGVPLIRWCAYYGDVSAIRYLLSQGEQLASMGENLDLNGAAFHGHWRLCEFLVEKGADPNRALGATGETPLHAALSRANHASVERVAAVLLAAGADPQARALDGAETGCFMRDSRTRGETPLHRAGAFAGESTIQMLLDAGGSPASRDAHGDTPLSWASWHLRPAAILRRLCFDGWSIHPDADWSGDHGAGWPGMDEHLLGRPHTGAGAK